MNIAEEMQENQQNEKPLFSFLGALCLVPIQFVLVMLVLIVMMLSAWILRDYGQIVSWEYNVLKSYAKLWQFPAQIVAVSLMIYWIKRRLIKRNNPETILSYLGFHTPNWGFFCKWTVIIVLWRIVAWSVDADDSSRYIFDKFYLQHGIWWGLFVATIAAPLWEELFFRGILWTAIHDSTNSERIAFWLSSLLFFVGHLNYQPFHVLVPHLLFCWLAVRARTQGGTLAFAIWFHFLWNFLVACQTLTVMAR